MVTHDVFLNEDNILDFIGEVDVAVEAFDGPQSKATLVSTWKNIALKTNCGSVGCGWIRIKQYSGNP